MIRKFAVLLVLVVAATLAFGQDATSTSHFSVSASAVGFSGGGTSSASTIAGGSVNLTQRFALGYEQVVIPNLSANYYLGTINYTVPLKALVGKKIDSKFVFNSEKWSTTFFGGAGVLRQDITGTQQQHVASTVGVGLNYVADGHLTVNVVQGQWLHAGVAGPLNNQFLITPDTAAVSSGLRLTF